MKKKCIFISCGTNTLNVIDLVMKKDWTNELGDGFKIDKFYCFEPLDQFNSWVKEFPKDKYDVEIEFINKAVWNEKTNIQFYASRNTYSSTLCPHKSSGGPRPAYKCEAVDFSEWLKNNVSKDDLVICDMDIECSEYVVLPHLIKNKTINLIDYLIIEWHGNKCGDWNDEQLHTEITKHVKLLDHNAIGIGE